MTINDYENGGLKLIDRECMVKSLRLAWLKRISSINSRTWKRYSSSQIRRTFPF